MTAISTASGVRELYLPEPQAMTRTAAAIRAEVVEGRQR
jgi:hypothetical protein